MERIYRRSPVALLSHLVAYVVAPVLLCVILQLFIDIKIAVGIALVICAYLLFDLFVLSRLIVIVTDDMFVLKQGTKSFQYDRKSVEFSSQRVNNDRFTLYVIDHGNVIEEFDISLLGLIQYNKLLYDLNIIGENSKPVKAVVKKKN